MKIKVRLMGMLKEKEPIGNELEIEAATSTINEILTRLGVDATGIHVFTVNGSLVRDKQFELGDGDDLTVFPPVGGG